VLVPQGLARIEAIGAAELLIAYLILLGNGMNGDEMRSWLSLAMFVTMTLRSRFCEHIYVSSDVGGVETAPLGC